MKVRYWQNFTKRKNSTKRPDLTQGTEIEVYLKDNCSLENPVFVIDDDLKTWGYCYAPTLSRYYFITDIVSISSYEYEVHCTLDVAGTFRDSIRAYTAFVERSASAYDVMVTDSCLSQQQDIVYKAVSGSETTLDSSGVYIVPVAGYTGLQLTAHTNLVTAGNFLNGRQVKKPSGALPLLSELDDIFTTAGYQIFNIQDYMGSMYWLPLPASIISAGGNLSAGMFDTGISYNELGIYEYAITGSLNVPSNYYSDWRAHDPRFSRYSIWLPSIGTVGLDPLDASEQDLYFDMMVDCLSGMVNYRIYHSNGADVASYDGMIKINIPFGQSKTDYSAPVVNTVSGAVSGAMLGGGVGAVIGGATGLMNGINTLLSPQTSISSGGGNKSIIQDRPDIYVSVECYGSKEFPTTDLGRPLYQNVTLGNLSGFVKCANASIPINGLDHVREEINNMLNTGIYIE